MATNVYDCLLLLDSNKYARDAAGISSQITELIESPGGEVLASRLWMEQKLAYPIAGHKKGTYWLTYFRMDSQKLDEFKRGVALNDAILRSLILKVDPRLVDTLVAHVRGESLEEEPEEEAGEEREAGEPATAGAGEASTG